MSTPTEIATAALSVKKADKAFAQQQILRWSETYDIPAAEAAPLYAYFMPPIPAKAKTPEQWVAKAVAVKDPRGYLRFIYSDGTRLIATDGGRLHLIPTDRPAGYYDKAMNPVDDQGTYPQIDRLFTTGTPHVLTLSEMPVTPSAWSKSGHTYLIDGSPFDKRQVDEMADGTEVLIIELSDNKDPIISPKDQTAQTLAEWLEKEESHFFTYER